MPTPENQLDVIQKELQWINIEDIRGEVPPQKTIYKILVPAGVLVTAGVLGSGLYHMIKRDSRKQQLFMRYRLLAQGITVAIATLGIFHVKLTS